MVLCSAEDGLADTIRPRLDAAGGDLYRVLALATVRTARAAAVHPGRSGDIRWGIERVEATASRDRPAMAFLAAT